MCATHLVGVEVVKVVLMLTARIFCAPAVFVFGTLFVDVLAVAAWIIYVIYR